MGAAGTDGVTGLYQVGLGEVKVAGEPSKYAQSVLASAAGISLAIGCAVYAINPIWMEVLFCIILLSCGRALSRYAGSSISCLVDKQHLS